MKKCSFQITHDLVCKNTRLRAMSRITPREVLPSLLIQILLNTPPLKKNILYTAEISKYYMISQNLALISMESNIITSFCILCSVPKTKGSSATI